MKSIIIAATLSLMATFTNASQLEIPESLVVNKVNGQSTPSYQRQIELAEGTQLLELSYVELLQPNAEDHQLVSSEPLYLRFKAALDQHYRITLPKLDSDNLVQEFAKAPRFTIRSDQGEIKSDLLTQSQLLSKLASTLNPN